MLIIVQRNRKEIIDGADPHIMNTESFRLIPHCFRVNQLKVGKILSQAYPHIEFFRTIFIATFFENFPSFQDNVIATIFKICLTISNFKKNFLLLSQLLLKYCLLYPSVNPNKLIEQLQPIQLNHKIGQERYV